tara:strand:+ start:3398 stop:4489 length:1092 start_codon:yes stop_codon:yes gene_type:complete
MALNFLQLTNRTLNRLNEVELTSANFTSSTGIQTTAKNGVNDAIRDIVAAELEWPFNVAAGSDTLIPGTQEYTLATGRSYDWDSFFILPVNIVTNGEFTSDITSWTDKSAGSGTSAYTSDGNGRLRLTGDGTDIGASEQTLATVVNRTYRILIRHVSNDVTLTIGTTTGGTNLLSETVALDNAGEGEMSNFTFVATTTTSFLRFANTSTTAVDIDFVRVREDKMGRELELVSQDSWRKGVHGSKISSTSSKKIDTYIKASNFGYPDVVYKTQNGKYGVSPVPDQANYGVTYDYWTIASDLSAYDDNTNIPDQYEHVIIHRAIYYCLVLRSDATILDRMDKQFNTYVDKMRTELINKPDAMVAL